MTNHTDTAQKPPLPLPEIDRKIAPRHPLILEASEYWKSHRGDRAMPSRADLDPKAMRKLLPHMALVEPRARADGAPDYFVRLAGTRLEQIYGPMAGRFIGEAVTIEIATRWQMVLDAVANSAAPLRTMGRMMFEQRSWVEVESFMAPLSHDGRTVSMLFIVVATWSAGKPPV
jgi:hypothetical protein